MAIRQLELALMNTAAKTRQNAHECKHCGQLFDQLSAYKEHVRIHTGVKPYGCKHCDKCFGNLTSCKRHERTHTGERPYSCKYCQKCFSVSSNCKQHERTHTGEKPYSCKHCNKYFSSLASCKKHEQHCHLKLRRHLQQPTTTHGSKKARVVFSSTEENSSQVESLTCWICQEEIISETCLIKHYDDHMR